MAWQCILKMNYNHSTINIFYGPRDYKTFTFQCVRLLTNFFTA